VWRRDPDEEIRAAVWIALRADRYLAGTEVVPKVERGVVTLTGTVDDYLQIRYAWDDAWDTPGVIGVVDALEVREGAEG
jgi:osmotically-inducible protein OsmY